MHADFIRALKGQVVELEYQPPRRSSPEHFAATLLPIVWDLFFDDKITLLILRETTFKGPAPQSHVKGTRPAQGNQKSQKQEPLYNFTFKWLETEYITSIKTTAGFHIDVNAGRVISEDEIPLYPEPKIKPYQYDWDKGIWDKVEAYLVKLGVRPSALAYPVERPQPAQPAPELTIVTGDDTARITLGTPVLTDDPVQVQPSAQPVQPVQAAPQPLPAAPPQAPVAPPVAPPEPAAAAPINPLQ